VKLLLPQKHRMQLFFPKAERFREIEGRERASKRRGDLLIFLRKGFHVAFEAKVSPRRDLRWGSCSKAADVAGHLIRSLIFYFFGVSSLPCLLSASSALSSYLSGGPMAS
jgi:hypothetical protein